ncbi:LTA synthase family protein [Bacillus timonensis]|nr:LTA synthase family protein [Bacillus timonensis]
MRISSFTVSHFWLIAILLCIKTFFVSIFTFDLQLESFVQEFILLLSALGSSVCILSVALFAKKEKRLRVLVFSYLFATIILYGNVLYYRFFNDFITIPVLFQSRNLLKLGTSIFELITPLDVLFFFELPLFWLFLKRKVGVRKIILEQRKGKIIAIALVLLSTNLYLAHEERPELLTRSFDRKLLVKNLGIYSYHLYDFIMYSNMKRRIAFADNDQVTEIINYVKASKEESNENLFGIAKGKNVFLISLESTQSFVVNRQIDGQEITPFLNQLIRDRGTYYFSDFYHQTGQGKTSDSEFIVENSMYGLPRGAVFFSNPENTYHSMASLLKEKAGYYTAVFHANNKSFWNRDIMYDALGYDRFYSDEDFLITADNSIGWGLKDDEFFLQSIPYLKELPQPFYAKFITLTNHFPFSLSKKDEYIPEWNSKDGTVNRYFTTVRYQDEALKVFFQKLKEQGLYENSIFVLYGDHYGISENHNKAMSQFLEKKITPFETINLQKVPLILHFPGRNETRTVTSVSGQIDLKPTLLNLLGVSVENDIMFGSDLFSEEKKQFVILRDGSFVTDQFIMTDNKCYDKNTALPTDQSICMPYLEMAKKELDFSDQVIYGDLLRVLGEENP